MTTSESQQIFNVRQVIRSGIMSFRLLSRQEREIIFLRYGLDQLWAWSGPRTLHETALKSKTNYERVRQVEEKFIHSILTNLH